MQSPPVGREDIAQQVVPGLSKLPKSPQNLQKDSNVVLRYLLTCVLITLLALAMILGVVVHMHWHHYEEKGIIDLQQRQVLA